jgi:hypothetical protein
VTAGVTEAEGAEIPAVAVSVASVECREACQVVLEAVPQAASAALVADLREALADSAADLREALEVLAVDLQVEVTVTAAVDSHP